MKPGYYISDSNEWLMIVYPDGMFGISSDDIWTYGAVESNMALMCFYDYLGEL